MGAVGSNETDRSAAFNTRYRRSAFSDTRKRPVQTGIERSNSSGMREYGGDDIYGSEPKYHPGNHGQFFRAGLSREYFRFQICARNILLVIQRNSL